MKQKISASRLRELLRYDSETGEFFWIMRPMRARVKVGGRAGSVTNQGYRRICIDSAEYRENRLAWLYITGVWPHGEVDHIDGCRSNNAWSNLRVVTRTGNAQNQRRARSDSKTRLLGVCPNGRGFQAQIKLAGKSTGLGTFDTAEKAHAAYINAKRRLHSCGTL